LELQERRRKLSLAIGREVAGGARVESQGDDNAVLVSGRPINHALHGLLGLVTYGIWWVVWAWIIIPSGGETRRLLHVDATGTVSNRHLSRDRGENRILVLASVLAVAAIIFLVVSVLAILAMIAFAISQAGS
jgi:hypothetical protein